MVAASHVAKPTGGVAKVVNKRLSNGTVVRVYFYKDRKSQQAAVKGMKRGTK